MTEDQELKLKCIEYAALLGGKFDMAQAIYGWIGPAQSTAPRHEPILFDNEPLDDSDMTGGPTDAEIEQSIADEETVEPAPVSVRFAFLGDPEPSIDDLIADKTEELRAKLLEDA